MSLPSGLSPAASQTADLFALTDEQILQIEPDAQDIEIFAGERSDALDPLREDLALLVSSAADGQSVEASNVVTNITKGVTAAADTNVLAGAQNSTAANPANATTNSASTANDAPPAWLAARMNDPQLGPEARQLWQSTQAARQEASAFREVFAKPEEARAAATRARLLDEIDGAYFGAPGVAPEQVNASRAQLAAAMLREDPAAFREMVYAGLRALEAAGHASNDAGAPREQGSAPPLPRLAQAFHNPSNASANSTQQHAASPFRASSSSQHSQGEQNATRNAQHANPLSAQNDARLAAYAAFERAANEELAHGVAGAIDRSLQQALPNAARTENGAALKERLSSAIRQDVEKALQGDRALGEQVARILAGQHLDATARAQVVRLIGERAQQLIPTAARRVLADWTQTTLGTHSARANRSSSATSPPAAAGRSQSATQAQTQTPSREAPRSATPARDNRKFDYRQLSDDDILNL